MVEVDPCVKEVVLKEISFQLVQALTPHLYDVSVRIGKAETFVEDVVTVTVEGILLGMDKEVIVLHYPANWWEMLKESHFPLWAKKRWPVRYTKVYKSAVAVFPELAPIDHSRYPVRFFWSD